MDYFKGQKTKIGRLLVKHYRVRKIKSGKWIQHRGHEEQDIELMIYANGDFQDTRAINYVDKKGYASWSEFNKQIAEIVKTTKNLDSIDLKHPTNPGDWDQFSIWKK